MSNKIDLYYHGKRFDNRKDFMEYVSEWKDLPLDEQTAESILKCLSKDIIMNVFLLGKEFTNSEFTAFAEKLYNHSMVELNGTTTALSRK